MFKGTMAFDGHQSTNSPFPTYQRQGSVNVGGGNNLALPFVSIPSDSLQEQDTTAYVPWPHNAHDDPYELTNYAQSSIKSRMPSDNTDCVGETDLQGLVSNILDEADSQESYYSEGTLPTYNTIWSPKTLKEEMLQYFQSEAKTQHNLAFPPNCLSHEAFSKAQSQLVFKDVEEFCQQPNGVATNQQLIFNWPNRDRDMYTLHSPKLPPGLPVSGTGNTYLPQMQQSKYDMSADKDRRNSQLINNFSDLNEVFGPQSDMNSPCLGSFYKDHYIQSSTKPISHEQYGPQDINQLVSSFQSLMAGEYDSFCRGDFPSMHKQILGMHYDDSMVEQRKSTGPALSSQYNITMQTPKQPMAEFGIVQRDINGELRKETFKCDAFQDLPGFNPQKTEIFEQPKPFSASLNLQKQYQNKTAMHRDNINMGINQYSKHHIQQGQILNKIKPQMQKEKMMHMSGFLGEGFPTRPLTNNCMRDTDKKQALSQNPYFDLQGNIQAQRFDGENNILNAGNTQQFMSHMYPVSDPRRHSSIPINSNGSSRATLHYGGDVPGMDKGDMMSGNESAVYNSCVGDMMTHRREGTYHGVAPTITTSVLINEAGPVIQLYFFLDKCYEQWRCLEKERKKIEVILTTTFFGKRTAAVANTNLPKTPPNPTRVDHLIVKLIKEQAKVSSLLDRMECLCNVPLHVSIHTALKRHYLAISITQARRKKEIANMSKPQQHRAHFTEDRDTLLLVALKDLAATTRKLRTALWCALQMILPKPAKRQDHYVEVTHRETCSSPYEGYSFKL